MIITSTTNKRIKEISQLKEKKARKISGLAIVEGEKMVNEAIVAGLVTTIVFVDNLPVKTISLLEQGNMTLKVEQINVNEFVFKSLSSQVTPSGILAVIKPKLVVKDLNIKGNFLILDKVRDPGNLGTIIRTAAAANFKEIFLIDCVECYNSKVLNSSMGAIFKVNLSEIDENDMQLLKQKNDNIIIFAADMHGKNLAEFKFNTKIKYGLILGNEANGISDYVMSFTDDVISLPMENKVESLNVAISGSIIMYAIYQS